MDYPKVKVCLDTSEDNLIDELYTPCLKWAERFDRGVGYFTTGWLTHNVAGLSDFASRGGKMRLITSPILSTEDTDAIIGAENQDGSAFLRLEAALLENVEILKQEMEADIINTFSWMLYDGIIDMRFAIPCEKLEEIDECHQALSKVLGKLERRLVLQIIDAKDRIAEETSIDSFIAGFELAWKLSVELNHYENERSVSCQTAMGSGARFASKEEEK